MSAEDRRQYPRADFPQIRLRFGRGPDLKEEVLHDLSIGGFFVSTDRTLPVGSEMEVHLELIELDEAYDLLGRVARIQLRKDALANGMAVEFLDMPRRAEQGLGQAVETFQERTAASLGPPEAHDEEGEDPAIRQFQERVRQLRKELMLSDERAAEDTADLEASRGVLEGLHQELEGERQKSQELAAEVERLRGELVEIKGLVNTNRELEGRVRALTNEVLDAREALMTARQKLSELESAGAEAEDGEEFEVTVLEAEPIPASETTAEGEEDIEERTLDPARELAAEAAQEESPPAGEELAATESVASGEETVADAEDAAEEASEVDGAAAEGEDAAVEDREPTPEEVAAELERSLGPEVVTTLADFLEHLEGGARLRTTDRFRRLEPVSREDIQVSDWLREADDVEGLERISQGRLGEDKLREVLYVFFERGLVRVLV